MEKATNFIKFLKEVDRANYQLDFFTKLAKVKPITYLDEEKKLCIIEADKYTDLINQLSDAK
jgi:hypothetical protein